MEGVTVGEASLLSHLCLGCMAYLDNPDEPCPNPECGWQQTNGNSKDQLPPRTHLVNRYMIGRSIGQGAFGITYIGWDIHTQRRVAIKEYYPRYLVDRVNICDVVPNNVTTVERFNRGKEWFINEGKRVSKFAFPPHIVNAQECFESNGTAYRVMQYVDGITFLQYIERIHRPLSMNETMKMFLPVFEGIEAAHSVGLIHRDINPQNMIVGNNGGVQILDFSASRSFAQQDETGKVINVKTKFAPNEMFLIRGSDKLIVDVYALSATIYYAVTMHFPATALERRKSLEQQGEDVLVSPMKYNSLLTPAQENAITTGMSIDPNKRYKSVKELSLALMEGENAIWNKIKRKIM